METVAQAVVDAGTEQEKTKAEFSEKLGELSQKLDAQQQVSDEQKAKLEEQQQAFNELKAQLDKEPEQQFRQRAPATGGDSKIEADC